MRLRRGLAIAAGVPVLAAGILVAEIELARRGPDLDQEPFDLDARFGPEDGPAGVVVWMGDSTAAGVGATAAAATVPHLVAEELASRRGSAVELRVVAVSGARAADVLADQLPAVEGTRPAMVFISMGANDAVHGTRVATFARRYRALLERLPEGADVVVLGVPDMGSPPRLAQPLRFFAGLNGERMDGAARREAERAGATYVDIAAATGPPFRRDPARYFAADRYHPSDAGYRLWADAVIAALG